MNLIKYKCNINFDDNINKTINDIFFKNIDNSILNEKSINVFLILNQIFTLFFKMKLLIKDFKEKEKILKTKEYNIDVIKPIDLNNKEEENISLYPAENNQSFVIDNTFTEFYFQNNKIENKHELVNKFINYKTNDKNTIEIINYLFKNKKNKLIENHPIIILNQLEKYISSGKYSEASMLLILKRNIFFNTKNQLIITELIHIQMVLMKYLFNNSDFHILSHLASIDFTKNVNKDDIKAKFLLLASSSFIACNLFKHALDNLEIVINLNCKSKQKAKAYYIIGMIYEYLYLLENNNDYLKLSKQFLNRGSKEINCFWSLLSMAATKQKPKIFYIDELSSLSSNISGSNCSSIVKAKELWRVGKYKESIKYIYDLKKSDFENFSPVLIDSLKFFINHSNKAAMYRIGCLCFKYTGKIIAECFNLPNYLNLAIQQNIISKNEAIELIGIISEESKFFDYKYYNLDTPFGLGIFQINPTEIKKITRKLNITYNKNEFLSNQVLQVRCAAEILRHHKILVNGSILFTMFYYVSGHKSYILQTNTSFFKQNHPLFSVVILSHIISGRTRRYLIGVLEFILLEYIIIYGKFPNLNNFL